jgi:hypothetical protein
MHDSTTKLQIFVSNSHKDERLLKKLETHLSQMRRAGVIANWHDRKIGAGAEWKHQINDHLQQADIILLLVSADFLQSDYCYDLEMTRALARHRAGEARVIPIILRPCDWESAPFGHLEALPAKARPVMKWSLQDDAFLDIVRGIRKVILEVRAAGPKVPDGGDGRSELRPVRSDDPDRPGSRESKWALDRLEKILVKVLLDRGYDVHTVTGFSRCIAVSCRGKADERCGGFLVVDYEDVETLADPSDEAVRDEISAFAFQVFEGPFDVKALSADLSRMASSMWSSSNRYDADGVQTLFHGDDGIDLAPIKRIGSGEKSRVLADPIRLSAAFLHELCGLSRVDRGARLATLLGVSWGDSDSESKGQSRPASGKPAQDVDRLVQLLIAALRPRGYRIRRTSRYSRWMAFTFWGTPEQSCGGFLVVDFDEVESLNDPSDHVVSEEITAFAFHVFDGPFDKEALASDLSRMALAIWVSSSRYNADGVQTNYHDDDSIALVPLKRPSPDAKSIPMAEPVRLSASLLQELWTLRRIDRGARLATLLGADE